VPVWPRGGRYRRLQGGLTAAGGCAERGARFPGAPEAPALRCAHAGVCPKPSRRRRTHSLAGANGGSARRVCARAAPSSTWTAERASARLITTARPRAVNAPHVLKPSARARQQLQLRRSRAAHATGLLRGERDGRLPAGGGGAVGYAVAAQRCTGAPPGGAPGSGPGPPEDCKYDINIKRSASRGAAALLWRTPRSMRLHWLVCGRRCGAAERAAAADARRPTH
jgi:hypothetical protein